MPTDAATDAPWWAPPLLALQFLSRLPLPWLDRLTPDQARVGLTRAVGWLPLAGTLIGAITAAVFLLAARFWPPLLAATVAVAVEALVTGAFHEDAVADFCDAFGGGRTEDEVRRILKDSRIGSYGTVGLALALALRVSATATLAPGLTAAAIVGAASFGRLLVVVLMRVVPHAPARDGLTKDIGRPPRVALPLAMMTALPGTAGLLVLAPARLAVAVAASAAFAFWLRALLLRRIGGSTGDALGFAAYAGQLMVLLACAAG